MATMDTSYLPSGALQTTTSGAAGGGAAGSGLLAALLPMLQQSLARRNKTADLDAELHAQQVNQAIGANSAEGKAKAKHDADVAAVKARELARPVHAAPALSAGDSTNSAVSQLANMRAGMEAEQAMKDRLPAPIRYASGAGIITGPTMDVTAMNAQQRKNFLPENANEREDPSRAQAAVANELDARRKDATAATAKQDSDLGYFAQQGRKMRTEKSLGFGGY